MGTLGLQWQHPHAAQFTLASIIDGRHDSYIRTWARTLLADGCRFFCDSPRR